MSNINLRAFQWYVQVLTNEGLVPEFTSWAINYAAFTLGISYSTGSVPYETLREICAEAKHVLYAKDRHQTIDIDLAGTFLLSECHT